MITSGAMISGHGIITKCKQSIELSLFSCGSGWPEYPPDIAHSKRISQNGWVAVIVIILLTSEVYYTTPSKPELANKRKALIGVSVQNQQLLNNTAIHLPNIVILGPSSVHGSLM